MKQQDNVSQIVWIVAAAAAIVRGATAQAAADTADAITHRYEAFEKTLEAR